ncbi:META domain-containing protein [Mycolicibacterium mengxianglii]|uniref:META domain-containing protein n=1 Tax=Mycolicibacterium mengxianglii TaxID=2736649 RepID=UPI0018EF1EA8|nr:META domain-containing protein [Mycolicibacterium mengxianglii]
MHAVRLIVPVSFAVSVAVLAGCGGTTEPRSLAGTSWQLTTIESMNDAQGITPAPPGVGYTVSFGADGTAAFQLDCNRGSGTYEADPTGDGTSGSLTFGPIAATLMGCPGPPEQQAVTDSLTAALPHVRGYVFKGQQLHMSLMADGGIVSWEPRT